MQTVCADFKHTCVLGFCELLKLDDNLNTLGLAKHSNVLE